MLSFSDPLQPERLTRRRFIQVGAMSAVGLTLPQLLRAEAAGATKRHKSCILIFCNGGPSQLDTFDMKPEAPSDIRGEFRPIPTTVPGMQICEHLPRLARRAHDFALIRTVSHTDALHPSATYWALTGHRPPASTLNLKPAPSHMPALGSALSRFMPSRRDLPSYVLAPQLCYDVGNTQPGQHAGMLGGAYDPFVVEGEPNDSDFHVQGLALNDHMSLARLRTRFELKQQLEERLDYLGASMSAQAIDAFNEQAFNLLSSPAAKKAFDLNQEPDTLRARYGRNRYGQSYLLARRLIESGVRTVMINDNIGSANDRWDTHSNNFPTLRKNLPETDAALATLLEDLRDRGLLDTTLVIWMGEIGRSPVHDHQDHWPQCYSVLMAGGGVQGGAIYGESDNHAAYPLSGGCTPGDVLATAYTAMGLPEDTEIHDQLGRPLQLFAGKPIREIL
ncbi:MAG: DUF1501 domain-containing protein [Phycisphaera sp.]|nr:DUF1501 domain-containing protein [Phycisphaera sp.]